MSSSRLKLPSPNILQPLAAARSAPAARVAPAAHAAVQSAPAGRTAWWYFKFVVRLIAAGCLVVMALTFLVAWRKAEPRRVSAQLCNVYDALKAAEARHGVFPNALSDIDLPSTWSLDMTRLEYAPPAGSTETHVILRYPLVNREKTWYVFFSKEGGTTSPTLKIGDVKPPS